MIIGFTGNANGANTLQLDQFRKLLIEYKAVEFHHGCCVGADHQAHLIAQELKIPIIAHPPIIRTKVGTFNWDKDFKDVKLPKPYLVRNHDIVDACGMMIATPFQKEEQLRSETWATIRYAKKACKLIFIVFPDGSIEIVKRKLKGTWKVDPLQNIEFHHNITELLSINETF